MTAVATSVEAAATAIEPRYQRTLVSGTTDLALGYALVLVLGVALIATGFAGFGAFAIGGALGFGVIDAAFKTPGRVEIAGSEVTLSAWVRTMRYSGSELLLRDQGRGRFVLATRARPHRAIAKFRDADGRGAVSEFAAAGVAVTSS